jgi:hypothetical protein
VEPGGLWDSDALEITAHVVKNGEPMTEVAMKYAGAPSQFEATLPALESGLYVVTVTAFDPRNGNAGVDTTTFMVR